MNACEKEVNLDEFKFFRNIFFKIFVILILFPLVFIWLHFKIELFNVGSNGRFSENHHFQCPAFMLSDIQQFTRFKCNKMLNARSGHFHCLPLFTVAKLEVP